MRRRPQILVPVTLCILTTMCLLFPRAAHASEAPSFRNDVMAVISKAGCNMGTCHGNANGKGGFRLSLRGEDPVGDYFVLTRGQFGRRIDAIDPAASLLLKKPTTQVAHQGGKRFDIDSLEYRILSQWIEAGAPRDDRQSPRLVSLDVTPTESVVIAPTTHVQVRTTATFSDDATRDV